MSNTITPYPSRQTPAGSSPTAGAAGPRPTYHVIWAEGATVVAVGASGATRSACFGSAEAIGIEFPSAAAGLALNGDSFTGFGTAVRVPQVWNPTLTSTTITNAQPSLTSIGVYTATLTGIPATSSIIRKQMIGARVEHAHRDIDMSGIAFTGIQHNAFANGEHLMPDVTWCGSTHWGYADSLGHIPFARRTPAYRWASRGRDPVIPRRPRPRLSM